MKKLKNLFKKKVKEWKKEYKTQTSKEMIAKMQDDLNKGSNSCGH